MKITGPVCEPASSSQKVRKTKGYGVPWYEVAILTMDLSRSNRWRRELRGSFQKV